MPMIGFGAALAQAPMKMKIVKIFALTEGEGESYWVLYPCLMPLWQDCSCDWPNQFEAPLYHCSAIEMLLI